MGSQTFLKTPRPLNKIDSKFAFYIIGIKLGFAYIVILPLIF